MGYIAADYRVKHRDYFHMKKFYKACSEYFMENGWCGRSHSDFPETKYLHRFLSNNTQELWIWWRFDKAGDGVTGGSPSTYFRYFLDVNFHVLYLKQVDYLYRGKKFKANLGEVEIKVVARLVTDYGDHWKNHWFLKHFEQVFEKRIIRGELQFHRVNLTKEAYKFQDWMKRFFNYPTADPYSGQGDFHPQLGIDEY
ncbi:hypothetical protein K9M79_00265 [Candidatus Woesearchaeota archaeon]|nr:hypothetical protein [Candidatus Woesearchaeota archaeon]